MYSLLVTLSAYLLAEACEGCNKGRKWEEGERGVKTAMLQTVALIWEECQIWYEVSKILVSLSYDD